MPEFKPFLFIGIVIGVIGGLIGASMMSSGNPFTGIAIMYLFTIFAAIAILWGFAGVLDEMNNNVRKTAELMDYLTDQLEEENAEDTKKVVELPGNKMGDDEIKKEIIRAYHECESENELAELLTWKFPGLSNSKVISAISELKKDKKLE